MTKAVVEQAFNTTTCAITAYDADKINLGTQMVQSADIDGNVWVGPEPVKLIKPGIDAGNLVGFGAGQTWNWSDTVEWIFIADGGSPGSTAVKRCGFFVMRKGVDSAPVFKGAIALTLPPATNNTLTSQAVYVYTYSTGTISASGTSVTGSGTSWQSSGQAVGARIGFGSTDPTQIADTNWFEITAIGSNTGITIDRTAGTVAGSTAYVIEEIRIYTTYTNATNTNGGLFITKGINPNTFINSGTLVTVPAAVSTDNIRACYWLADASTVTNITAAGIAVLPKESDTVHYAYVINGSNTTSLRLFKYNLRAALTLSSGKDTTAFQFSTATFTISSGVIGASFSAVYANANHGPGAGIGCIYVASQNRIVRIIESQVTADIVTPVTDEAYTTSGAWPGSGQVINAGNMQSIGYCSSIDRFLLGCNVVGPSCTTKYIPSKTAIETILSTATRVSYTQSAQFAESPPQMMQNAGLTAGTTLCGSLPVQPRADSGYVVFGDKNVGWGSIFPIGTHWKYAATTNQRVITPRIATANCLKYYRVYVMDGENVGGPELGTAPEPYRVYYRTCGITDNTGSWTLLNRIFDLSGVGASDYIQFMFEFKTIGRIGLFNFIYRMCVVYEADSGIPEHLAWSISNASLTSATKAFTQIKVKGSVPNLEINYYSLTGILLLTQKSTSNTNGEFQYHDGANWVAGLGPDALYTKRKFVPATALPAASEMIVRLREI